MSTDRLQVDPIACQAHGLCAELLPELIRLDEWGYPILSTHLVPDRLRAAARQAVNACPTLALRLSAREPERPPTRESQAGGQPWATSGAGGSGRARSGGTPAPVAGWTAGRG